MSNGQWYTFRRLGPPKPPAQKLLHGEFYEITAGFYNGFRFEDHRDCGIIKRAIKDLSIELGSGFYVQKDKYQILFYFDLATARKLRERYHK